MADTRVYVIYQFASKHQQAKIQCKQCRRIVILPPAEIAKLFPPITLVEQAARRLRCRHCGAREATLSGVYREYHG